MAMGRGRGREETVPEGGGRAAGQGRAGLLCRARSALQPWCPGHPESHPHPNLQEWGLTTISQRTFCAKTPKNKPLCPSWAHFPPGAAATGIRSGISVEWCLGPLTPGIWGPLGFPGSSGAVEETKPEGAVCTNIYLQKSKVHMIQALYTVVKTRLFYVFLLPESKENI